MKQNAFWLILCCSTLLLTGCSSQTPSNSSPNITGLGPFTNEELVLKSIVILPTEHTLIPTAFNEEQVKTLNFGAQTLTNLIENHFSNTPTIHLISRSQADAYLGSYVATQLKEARYIGMHAEADAVLISQIYKFRELDGKKYGANNPASVSFDYQLIHLESGITLCKGSYDETQQPLLSNIFAFGKASKRKFKFVKGAELLQEGLEAKFAQCSHLSQ